jgi:hypothetical protein
VSGWNFGAGQMVAQQRYKLSDCLSLHTGWDFFR